MEIQAGNDKAAIKSLRRIEQQDISYLGEAIPLLVECYQRQGRLDELMEYLEQLMTQQQGVSAVLVLSEQIQKQQGETAAIHFITESLKKRPSIRLLDKLIDLNIRQSVEAGRDKLQILKDVTTKLLSNMPIYQCHLCGFSSKQLYWQCPGCRAWESLKTIQGVEGD